MSITLIGWIFIILTIYALIVNREFLLELLVFSSVFTAAAVINIETSTTGIQPFYFVGTIWIITVLIKHFKNKIAFNKFISICKKNKLIRSLGIFGIIIILSEVYLLLFNGKIKYLDAKMSEVITVVFTKSNITQPIFLLFMVVISILLVIEIDSRKKITKIIRAFAIGSIFALLWGIAQFCMYYINIQYPDWLFNNNISFLQLHFQMIYGLKRVNSIALEPSTFALNIIVFLPMIMILWLANYKTLINRKMQIGVFIILLLSLVCAVLTTSTTAYVGIFLIVASLTVYILFFSQKQGELNKNKKRIGVFYIIGVLSIIIVIFVATQVFDMYWGTLWDALKDVTVNKINLETGSERTNAILTSLNILKQSPIFGAGFGSFRSLDLTTNLLSNMGILGLGSFLFIIYTSLNNAFINFKKNETNAVILITTLVVSTIALLISIPDLTFGYYWITIVVVNLYFNFREETYN